MMWSTVQCDREHHTYSLGDTHNLVSGVATCMHAYATWLTLLMQLCAIVLVTVDCSFRLQTIVASGPTAIALLMLH